ncbi:hypothetical protein [Caballeronia sp. LZ034LL]|uniref:hypothetical protein n=1 Tax=Caballeronia sp. LZ034LL TaxID=3038567 RepID=UPI00285C6714|nr:hypothetical protein [Caballeronia sp. LZ034LL]MDR5839339.1 hypothetical protein [Caballeronia sp. LZ034LL]
MPKKNRGVQLLLLIAIAGGVAWQQAGYYASDVEAANAGAKAITSGKAFARKLIQA